MMRRGGVCAVCTRQQRQEKKGGLCYRDKRKFYKKNSSQKVLEFRKFRNLKKEVQEISLKKLTNFQQAKF